MNLWNGKLAYEYDGINYALGGEPINIKLDFRITPVHEDNFADDATYRNKGENHRRRRED